jgi:hypothetical protein
LIRVLWQRLLSEMRMREVAVLVKKRPEVAHITVIEEPREPQFATVYVMPEQTEPRYVTIRLMSDQESDRRRVKLERELCCQFASAEAAGGCGPRRVQSPPHRACRPH